MQDVPTDAVLADDGHTYDRAALSAWIARRQGDGQLPTSPVTRDVLGLNVRPVTAAWLGSQRVLCAGEEQSLASEVSSAGEAGGAAAPTPGQGPGSNAASGLGAIAGEPRPWQPNRYVPDPNSALGRLMSLQLSEFEQSLPMSARINVLYGRAQMLQRRVNAEDAWRLLNSVRDSYEARLLYGAAESVENEIFDTGARLILMNQLEPS